jgi:CO dehydrogenase/acetyl-CoA synthase gamma subunit (corrinoid Fe-S protein)
MSDKDGGFLADIYRLLPGKDCGKDSPCGCLLCRDFSKILLKGDKTVYDCPHLEDDFRQEILLILEDYYRG